jgi:cytochrome c oxidase subunit 4
MIVPTRIYYRVAAALFVLFALTVAVAYTDLGMWNIYIAVTIAVIKATLVVLYFMHVRYHTRLTWIFASAGFLWLIILFSLTLADYATRS